MYIGPSSGLAYSGWGWGGGGWQILYTKEIRRKLVYRLKAIVLVQRRPRLGEFATACCSGLRANWGILNRAGAIAGLKLWYKLNLSGQYVHKSEANMKKIVCLTFKNLTNTYDYQF